MRPVLAALAAVVLTAGLTACSSAEGQGQPGPQQAGPQQSGSQEAGSPDEKAREYVAMGDSYTSAPFIGETDNHCARGAENYPALVADRLDLALTDVSCAGAGTDAVWRPYDTYGDEKPQPPQVDALSRSTDVVTMSFGGNDFSLFSRFVQNCVTSVEDRQGAPCTRADAAAGGEVERDAGRITDRLVRALRGITAAAPHAHVVVVSYPDITPARSCAQFPITDGDVRFGQRVNALIVDAQRTAARRAGVDFVDVYAATAGHDVCSPDPYVAGATPTAPAAPYHPYAQEQQVVADLLAHTLTRS